MNSFAVSLIVFSCVFGSALAGFFVRRALPQRHLSSDTLLAFTLTTGLAATLSSLVLGLIISSTHASFNKLNDVVALTASKTVLIDCALANYGPEAAQSRVLLAKEHQSSMEYLHKVRVSQFSDADVHIGQLEALINSLYRLETKSETQIALKAYVITQAQSLAETRWLLVDGNDSSIPYVFFIALVAWLAFIFFGFGLLTENNSTVLLSLLGGALIVSSALFVIIELDHPLDGLVSISVTPMEKASSYLGKP